MQLTLLMHGRWHNESFKMAHADIYSKADKSPNSWLGLQCETQQHFFVLLFELKCLII